LFLFRRSQFLFPVPRDESEKTKKILAFHALKPKAMMELKQHLELLLANTSVA